MVRTASTLNSIQRSFLLLERTWCDNLLIKHTLTCAHVKLLVGATDGLVTGNSPQSHDAIPIAMAEIQRPVQNIFTAMFPYKLTKNDIAMGTEARVPTQPNAIIIIGRDGMARAIIVIYSASLTPCRLWLYRTRPMGHLCTRTTTYRGSDDTM